MSSARFLVLLYNFQALQSVLWGEAVSSEKIRRR